MQKVNLSRLDQRAWVGVPEAIDTKFNIDRPVETGVWIVNHGATPARNVYAQVALRSAMTAVGFKPVYPTRSTRSSVVVLQPGAKVRALINSATGDPPFILTTAILENIRAGSRTVWLHGRITYDDIFDHPHVTTFCFVVATTVDRFDVCGEYNDAR